MYTCIRGMVLQFCDFLCLWCQSVHSYQLDSNGVGALSCDNANLHRSELNLLMSSLHALSAFLVCFSQSIMQQSANL